VTSALRIRRILAHNATVPVAYIPSPHTGVLHAGPFVVHLYGVALLLGIVACIWLTGVRWTRRGGDWDLVFRVAVWGVGAGIVGARLYHDLTSWNEVPHTWWGPFAVWKGGLGVWGGIGLGIIVGAWVVHRAGESVLSMMDCVAPGLLLAQGIGRLGNYFNQELYGKPTKLPWGLEIDPAHRLAGYFGYRTYHPTFLYELLWDLAGVGLLLLVERRYRLARGNLFVLYVAYYTFGRTFEELLRIDPAHHFLGMRLNFWVSVLVFAAAVAIFVRRQRSLPPDEPGEDEGKPRSKRPRPRFRRRRAAPAPPSMAIPKQRVRPSR
jgi:prolipoprotein diacylglyceryl transferase